MPPINKGTNASKVLASKRTHPLQSVCGAVGIVYELPKKWGCSLSRDTFLGPSALGCSDGVGSQGSSQLTPDMHRYALTLALHDALNASCACFGLPLLDQFDVGPALLK